MTWNRPLKNETGFRLALGGALLLAALAPAGAQTNDPGPLAATALPELVSMAQGHGGAPDSSRRREQARAELVRRGEPAYRFLVARIHEGNESIREQVIDFAHQQRLPPEVLAPVLVEALGSPDGLTRRICAFSLGFLDRPDLAPQVQPLLSDDVAGGAAARTLGKWRVREAVPGILALLTHPREPRRVIAANALRDIGDPAAIVPLIAALSDERFTVRKAASRALVSFGERSEKPLIAALGATQGTARREVVRTLGALQSRRATRPLRRLRASADPALVEDIDKALAAIAAPKRPPAP